jgi:hypothetical protein
MCDVIFVPPNLSKSFFQQLGRAFIDSGQIKSKYRGEKMNLRHFLLFHDTLLICKIFKGKGEQNTFHVHLLAKHKQFKFVDEIILQDCRLEYVKALYTFKIICTPATWTLIFDNPSTFLVWIGHISKVALASVEKEEGKWKP